MYSFIKRLFDILASGLAILVLSPLLIIVIIGIEVSDPGPIFYLAKRVGQNNKQFNMFKFRSMRVDKNANEKNFTADTNRIFKFGALIRKTKIDELPQLINVFIGQMSVIGPRPAAVDQVEITRNGDFEITSKLKPGLSGPSALYDYIYGDTITNEEEYRIKVLPTRLKLDVYYYHHRSILYDIKMIVYTVICIICSILNKHPKSIYDELIESANLQ